eukprot:gnl/MRDRNA2_/MRDRNA2_71028_c0_seq1.p1 gnl/MRDRNA2_/MRDRNA2_71028_c0~~gnl/MRDRNA2_/MRDRNA2_71028_c0_seq1.p1  ORF type:complete len:430 (+),score=132.20 gnl/MRDRNA2_/MRDRNA2_71028_c0_seq1:72-1292(+)
MTGVSDHHDESTAPGEALYESEVKKFTSSLDRIVDENRRLLDLAATVSAHYHALLENASAGSKTAPEDARLVHVSHEISQQLRQLADTAGDEMPIILESYARLVRLWKEKRRAAWGHRCCRVVKDVLDVTAKPPMQVSDLNREMEILKAEARQLRTENQALGDGFALAAQGPDGRSSAQLMEKNEQLQKKLKSLQSQLQQQIAAREAAEQKLAQPNPHNTSLAMYEKLVNEIANKRHEVASMESEVQILQAQSSKESLQNIERRFEEEAQEMKQNLVNAEVRMQSTEDSIARARKGECEDPQQKELAQLQLHEAKLKEEIEELGHVRRRMSRRQSVEATWKQWQSIEAPEDAVQDLQREVDALDAQQEALEASCSSSAGLWKSAAGMHAVPEKREAIIRTDLEFRG